MTESYIVDAARTPIGRIGGALADIRPDDLLAWTLRAILERNPRLDPAEVDEIYAGSSNSSGEDNRNVARMAALLAGYPSTVPGATVNRLCGSGLEAVLDASRAVEVGDASIAIAAGVESMTRAPWVLQKPSKAYPTGHEQLWSTTLGWRMVNPQMPVEWTVSLGEATEILVDKYAISRDEQDCFALESHRRAAEAWDNGLFDLETVCTTETGLQRDECIRPDTSLEALGRLKPAFRPNGSVTAGNSSPMNDGAAALLITSKEGAERLGAEPLARIVSRATSGIEPHLFGLGPVRASTIALRRASLTWGQISAVELNEAFAAQSIACMRELPELDPSTLNTQGGAIAIGHPIGCSGARVLTTLCYRLKRSGGRYGLATMCIGVGQGIAVVIENLS
jgi:acetyl-CoA acetyltransferase family protein